MRSISNLRQVWFAVNSLWITSLVALLSPICQESTESYTGSVGFPIRIDQIVIQGSKVEPIPMRDRAQPVIVRILEVFPHGTDNRYDLEIQVLEKGKFDVAKYLRRVDGDDTKAIAPIMVSVDALLPEATVEPLPLVPQSTGYAHYYVPLLVLVGGIWLAGLLMILFYGRGKTKKVQIATKNVSFADRLRPLVELAVEGDINAEQQAELERLLTTYWSRELRLSHLPASELRTHLRQHQEAAQLLNKMDDWMYRPDKATETDAEIAELLKPYRAIPDMEV